MYGDLARSCNEKFRCHSFLYDVSGTFWTLYFDINFANGSCADMRPCRHNTSACQCRNAYRNIITKWQKKVGEISQKDFPKGCSKKKHEIVSKFRFKHKCHFVSLENSFSALYSRCSGRVISLGRAQFRETITFSWLCREDGLHITLLYPFSRYGLGIYYRDWNPIYSKLFVKRLRTICIFLN